MAIERPLPKVQSNEVNPGVLKRNPEAGLKYFQRLELNRENLLKRLEETNWTSRKQARRIAALNALERILGIKY